MFWCGVVSFGSFCILSDPLGRVCHSVFFYTWLRSIFSTERRFASIRVRISRSSLCKIITGSFSGPRLITLFPEKQTLIYIFPIKNEKKNFHVFSLSFWQFFCCVTVTAFPPLFPFFVQFYFLCAFHLYSCFAVVRCVWAAVCSAGVTGGPCLRGPDAAHALLAVVRPLEPRQRQRGGARSPSEPHQPSIALATPSPKYHYQPPPLYTRSLTPPMLLTHGQAPTFRGAGWREKVA